MESTGLKECQRHRKSEPCRQASQSSTRKDPVQREVDETLVTKLESRRKRSYFTLTLLQVVAMPVGCRNMSPHRCEVGREEVGNETCSDRVEHC